MERSTSLPGRHVAGTTPYPWPFDGDLTGGGTALLVVAGPAPRPAGPQVADRIGKLARAVRAAGGAVIAASTTLPQRCTADLVGSGEAGAATPGWAAAGELLAGETPDHFVAGAGVDAFYGTDLALILQVRGIRRLILAGAGLETCVHSTMRDANDRGFECLLAIDACVPIDPAMGPAAASMIQMSGGIFGAVGRTAEVVSALRTAPVPAGQGTSTTNATAGQGEPR